MTWYINLFLIVFTDDLGLRINNQVQNSLNSVRSRLFFDENLGERINQDVQESIRPLNDLGARITSQIEQSLQPVKAMEILQNMAGGVGGVSVTYFDGSKYT